MRTLEYRASLHDVVLRLTPSDVANVQSQGPADNDIAMLAQVPRIARQLDSLDADEVRGDLRETGGWDAEELSDASMNRERILWIAVCSIREEMHERTR